MSNTVLTCTACGMSNVFPIANISVPVQTVVTTFCGQCDAMTPQLPVPHTQNPETNTSELLSGRLRSALTEKGIAAENFLRRDTFTQARLLSSLGFSAAELPQLVGTAEANASCKPIDSPTEGVQKYETPSIVMGGEEEGGRRGIAQLISSEPLPNAVDETVKEAPTMSAHGESVAVETLHNATTDTNVLFSAFATSENEMPIACCSVYPNLPAEFWCSLCGVLVSSRCHVTGIHKNHPFIALRQAAEMHVHDLGTWSERCRNQLKLAANIMTNLQQGKEILRESIKHQEEELERRFEDIVSGLAQWREELKASMRLQVNAQLKSIDVAMEKTSAFIDDYSKRRASCDPLLHSIPPVHQVDKQSEEWSSRVMDLVTKLKESAQELIPMPRLTVPEVKSFATMATYMDLLKAVSVPASICIPDVLDTGCLNFPNPFKAAQAAFTLQVPEDARERGILIYNGRTLTRSPKATPAHSLVCASTVVCAGITAWEVHIDRLGPGPGRALAGVLMAETDGEGVVWDGHRIVGPKEGECRLLPERYKLQTGTTLLFVLELETPSHFLTCFYENELAACVPLPPAPHGWIPTFSVFGPQDQLTVVPTSTTVAVNPLADTAPEARVREGEKIGAQLDGQELKVNPLNRQLFAANMRIDQDPCEASIQSSSAQRGVNRVRHNDKATDDNTSPEPLFRQVLSNLFANQDDLAQRHSVGSTHDIKTAAAADTRNDSYSFELRSLLNFVDSIKERKA